MKQKKALLFLNGTPPNTIPETTGYDVIACTDGAFNYLKTKNFPIEKLNFISGDFDSFPENEKNIINKKIILTPDQNKTDFEKALDILAEKSVKKIDVYGGSGKEMDHFLGNITVAFKKKENFKITFFDEFSQYFFIDKQFKINNIKGKLISLYPFPIAEGIVTKGLNWSLNNETLNQINRIGTRNFASENEIEISYTKGNLLIFIGK